MAETQCLKIKLKAGTTDYVRRWIGELLARGSELREVMENEGIIVESLFLEHAIDGDYLVLYQRATSLVKANEAFVTSSHPLDVATRQFIVDTWESVQSLELVFDWDGWA